MYSDLSHRLVTPILVVLWGSPTQNGLIIQVKDLESIAQMEMGCQVAAGQDS